MHHGRGQWIPVGGCGCCPPGPYYPMPGPRPEPEPERSCPPKIYRNPPDVILEAGRNITLDVEQGDFAWTYTVSTDADRVEVLPGDHVTVKKELTDEGANFTVGAVQFPVRIDEESSDVLYGNGTPGNPLGVYDFTGATRVDDGKPGAVPAPSAGDQEKFLRGDGNWATVPKQKQADWNQENPQSVDYIRNKPDIDAMIDSAVSEERTRATEAEAAATTEVRAGENASVDEEIAPDGHRIYTVNADGKPQVQADWNQDDPQAVDYVRNKPGVFSGATGETDGTTGFVPTPSAGEQGMFLRGDSTWADVDNTRECSALEMDEWIDEVENG